MEQDSYLSFVDKFEIKKSTDDCYTPPAIYDIAVDYVKEKCEIAGCEIVRPFYPGKDYQRVHYPPGCVVIDNPPFSIISAIIRYYNSRKIKFFLFAPHLTLFGSNQDYTAIVVGATITYDNGAKVKTSFVSNMFGDFKIIGDGDLYNRMKDADKALSLTKSLPSYKYPDNVLTVSDISKITERGGHICIKKSEVAFCRSLDSQAASKKTLFGSGFLISDKAAELKAAELNAAELKAAEKETKYWPLSEREANIINILNSQP